MDRPIVYPGALPRANDFLSLAQNAMVALAKLSETTLGAATTVDGFTLVPTSPATLSATLSNGSIYEQEDLEASSYSTLPANTTNLIVKQGIALGPQTLTFAPPTTVGYAQCFLVEASYQDSDTGAVTLPYYNASNPTVPYSGPGNAGTANNTVRQGAVAVQVKAGIAAPAGAQVAPTPDAGFVGLFLVTLAYGATTVTQGNIATYAGAPFLRAKLGQIPQALQNDQFNGFPDQGTVNAVVVNPVPAFTQYQPFQRLRVKMANAPTGPTTIVVSSIGAVPVVRQGGVALQGGEWAAGDFVEMVCTGNAFQLDGLTLPQILAFILANITSTQIFNITGGTGFSVVQSYGSFQPQAPSSHTLDYSFTAPAKGTVLAFSNIASTPQSGLANAANISVNGTLVASAGDSVSASITDIASYQVKGGDVVDVQSVVSNSQPLTYNTSQRLSLLFFPS